MGVLRSYLCFTFVLILFSFESKASSHADTDNDLVSDVVEVLNGTDPNDAASTPGTPLLAFDPAVLGCLGGLGTYPNNCTEGVAVVGGSYYGFDSNGSGTFTIVERVPLTRGPDGGIFIGQAQPASGSHTGPPNGTENTGLDNAWNFFNNTGVFLTTAPVTVVDPDVNNDGGFTKLLDFSGWAVEWNGFPASLGGDFINFPEDTGLATLTCSSANCPLGSTFTLDYVTHGDPNDQSFFSQGTFHTVHFEGQITNTDINILGDTDGDGMPDMWEILAGLNPADSSDALLDIDADGLNNLAEFTNSTDPNNADTDNDFVTDGVEVLNGTDPNDAASTPGTPLLAFDPAVLGCLGGSGTYPDNCTDGVVVVGGSYLGSDSNGSGTFSAVERTPLARGPDGGIFIGQAQPASGSHTGPPNGTENTGLDSAWNFFGNTGVFLTTAPVTVVDPDVNNDGGFTKLLDFSGWAVEWNGFPASLGGDFINHPEDTGLATLTCSSANCPLGSTFTLDYVTHGDPNNQSFFSQGTFHTVHFEGQITITNIKGDINQDGFVNAADIVLAKRHILNLIVLNPDQIMHGDLYPPSVGDSLITVSDLILLIQLVSSSP